MHSLLHVRGDERLVRLTPGQPVLTDLCPLQLRLPRPPYGRDVRLADHGLDDAIALDELFNRLSEQSLLTERHRSVPR